MTATKALFNAGICAESWARRFSYDLFIVSQAIERQALSERTAIDDLLDEICRFSDAQPDADEWHQLYTLTLSVLQRIRPVAIWNGNPEMQMAFRRLSQFIGDNWELTW